MKRNRKCKIKQRMKLKILWIYLLGLGTLTLSAQVIPNIYQLIDSVHQRIQTPNTEWLQRKIYDNGITLLKNQQERLPLKGLDKTRIASVTLGAPSSNPFQQYLKNTVT